ncbi:MAG: outer membrane beta-barrel protein [Deltaproteobacteria bacterium]|nr:outer membrane beta-barrel protein [Deltaproteobacteria bacterium]
MMRDLVVVAAITGLGATALAAAAQPAAPAPAAAPAPVAKPTPPAPAVTPAPAAKPARPTPAAAPSTSATVSPEGAKVTEIKAIEATAPAPAAEPAATSAPAESKLGVSLAAKLGGTLPTSPLGLTYFAGLEAGYRLPVLDHLLGVALELSAGQPKKSGSFNNAAAGGAVDYDLSQRMVVLAVEANAHHAFGPVAAYAGLGYGFYVLKATTTAFGETNSETQTRAGTQLRGGAGYALGPGEVFGEVRYHYVGLAFLATGHSNAGGVTVAAGYRLML